MTQDIVPDFLEKIQEEFRKNTAKSKVIKEKIEALANKKATHRDSNAFAVEVGKILSDAFGNQITSGVLPDDKMYYNIAKRVIEPNLKRNYDVVGDYTRDVQNLLNEQAGISLKAIKPEVNQERIDGIINKISEYDNFEEGKWLLEEPIINFTQAIVDDTVKTNVEFQYKSGLKPKIVRREAGNCCDWCKEIVGTYNYPEEVPKDVYRRHRYCRCTVEYHPGDGRRQDIWTKNWKDPDKDDKIRKRKELSSKPL